MERGVVTGTMWTCGSSPAELLAAASTRFAIVTSAGPALASGGAMSVSLRGSLASQRAWRAPWSGALLRARYVRADRAWQSSCTTSVRAHRANESE